MFNTNRHYEHQLVRKSRVYTLTDIGQTNTYDRKNKQHFFVEEERLNRHSDIIDHQYLINNHHKLESLSFRDKYGKDYSLQHVIIQETENAVPTSKVAMLHLPKSKIKKKC